MTDIRSVRMGDEERDEFLGRGGTGAISVSTPDDEPPYSRPVSYGYDAETGNFYFRFAVGPDDTGKSLHARDQRRLPALDGCDVLGQSADDSDGPGFYDDTASTPTVPA